MDNERIKLKLLGISYTPMQSGAFAMLLAEENGPHRIPVVIGASEAQSIAIKLENVITPRPITHDLFCNFAQAYGIRMIEAYIYKFEDGIFWSEIKFSDGFREITIDSRTSDAVALAVRTGAPIYTTPEILLAAGTTFSEAEEDVEETEESTTEKPERKLSLDELQAMLQKYIDDEDYEAAARISNIIKEKENELD